MLAVTIENLRDSALVAWEIGVVRPGDRRPAGSHAADFSTATKHGLESGPVPPHARRLVNIPIDGPTAGWTAVVNRVLFADGYREADSDVRSIHVTFVPAAIGKPYAVVQNLRHVPIEALMFVGHGSQDNTIAAVTPPISAGQSTSTLDAGASHLAKRVSSLFRGSAG